MIDPEVESTPEEYTWLDDEYYESAWSWVDECELEDEEDKNEPS